MRKRQFQVHMLSGPIPTLEEIAAARSEKGGYTRVALEKLGVPYPPPRGWLKELIAHAQHKLPTPPTKT
jgi:hypothetical protein